MSAMPRPRATCDFSSKAAATISRRAWKSRMQGASEQERYEEAAGYRDLLKTLEEMEERQKIAAAEGDDTDVVAWYAEPPQVAVNLFHMRGGRVVDRRDFYWEDLEEFDPAEFLPSLLKQLYLDAAYLPRFIHTPIDFEDRELLEEVLTEKAGHRVEILNPQRGQKHAFLELVEKNAKHSFVQRFRVLKPARSDRRGAGSRAGSAGAAEAHRDASTFRTFRGRTRWRRWWCGKTGRMKKSDYRKFIIRGEAMPEGAEKAQRALLRDDFASMREVGRAPIPAAAAERKSAAQPDPDRRRHRPTACGRAGAGQAGNHQSADGQYRQEGRNPLRTGPRGRADRARAPLACAASDPANSR